MDRLDVLALGWGQGSPGRPVNRLLQAAPGHTASSQSVGRATGGPWSSGGSPVPSERQGWRLIPASASNPAASCCPLQEMPSPHHLPYVVSDTPIGHHFQGVQGHLLGPGTILG